MHQRNRLEENGVKMVGPRGRTAGVTSEAGKSTSFVNLFTNTSTAGVHDASLESFSIDHPARLI